MSTQQSMVELWRGGVMESFHTGHAVICSANGDVLDGWGTPDQVIFPRSSCKMIQAIPLVESGAAAGLSPRHLAVACSSHQGARIHTTLVNSWLGDLGLGDGDLRCGAHAPYDDNSATDLIRESQSAQQCHNNCSGKHAGFLCLSKHLGGDAEYIDPAHPVQKAVRAAFEEMTQSDSPGFGIDGCSAPNFLTTVTGLARAAAAMTLPLDGSKRREACHALVDAMRLHPDLVAGEGRACTELMRACKGKAAIKTGAEGVFVAILPDAQIGVALKIADGATRAAEASITALLVKLGALEASDPVAQKYIHGPIRNRRDLVTGEFRISDGFA